jgi:hypothetical protein
MGDPELSTTTLTPRTAGPYIHGSWLDHTGPDQKERQTRFRASLRRELQRGFSPSRYHEHGNRGVRR